MISTVQPSQDLLLSIRSFLVPYLLRMDDLNPGDFYNVLHQFCIHQAHTDLIIPLIIVENSSPRLPEAVLTDPAQIVRLALDSCYALENSSQVALVERMFYAIVNYFEVAPGRPRMEFIHEHGLKLDEFKTFLQNLDIIKILARHDQCKGLSLFRDHDKNLGRMKKVFESITCHAESVKPRLDQDGWRVVLRDLQKLQKLIPIVPVERIYYMFCESLLSSGCMENIDLAGDVLKTMLEPDDQISLVRSAWTHYFSTSSNLLDPNIKLAKHCLCLINTNSKELLDCADLISSLQSLADFGLTDIHPITILNSKNRLDLVQSAINAKPLAYKNSQRLMKLATLLKAETSENLEGVVWNLVANKALAVLDIPACLTACNNIIQIGYTEGWKVCFALAVHDEFTDAQKATGLLSFAVTNCADENIENVMLSLLKVEQKLIHSLLSTRQASIFYISTEILLFFLTDLKSNRNRFSPFKRMQ